MGKRISFEGARRYGGVVVVVVVVAYLGGGLEVLDELGGEAC